MTRCVVLIAYESSEWEEATEEVRQSCHRDHDAFPAYVAEHGTEQLGGYYDVELPALAHALAAVRLLPAAYSVEIRPTITIG